MKFRVICVTLMLIGIEHKWLETNWNHLRRTTTLVLGMENKQMSQCPYIDSCAYNYSFELTVSANSFAKSCCKACACGEGCQAMKCCPDMVPCTQSTVSQESQYMVCIPPSLKRTPNSGILSIATCIDFSDGDTVAKCLQEYENNSVDITDIVPVAGVNNHIIYRNFHCARCNRLGQDDIEYFPTRVVCDDTSNLDVSQYRNIIEAVHKTLGCNIRFSNPTQHKVVNQCDQIIDRCNLTGLWEHYSQVIERECRTTEEEDYPMSSNMYFKNAKCVECNGFGMSSFSDPYSNKPSLTYFITFDRSSKPPTEQHTVCAPGMLFHESKGICLRARCSLLRRLQNNECVRTIPRVESYTYRVELRIKPESPLSIKTAYNLASRLGELLNDLLDSTFSSNKRTVFELSLISDLKFNETGDAGLEEANLLWYDVRLKLQNFETQDPEEKLKSLLHLADSRKLAIVTRRAVINFLVMLKDDPADQAVQEVVTKFCSSTFLEFRTCSDTAQIQYVDKNRTFETYYPSSLTGVIYIGPTHEQTSLTKESIDFERNILELKKCPSIEVSKERKVWKDTEFGIEFVNQRVFLNLSDFVYGKTGDSIWVCLEKYTILESSGTRLCLSRSVITYIVYIVIAFRITLSFISVHPY